MSKRLARLLWQRVLAAQNPWVNHVMNGRNRSQFDTYAKTQIELSRALYSVVYEDAELDDELQERVLDFLDGKTP